MIEIDSVLCFLTTAMNCLSKDEMANNAIAFFPRERISKSKEKLFRAASKEAPRRQGQNKERRDFLDMVELLETIDMGLLPTYVADSFDAFPPATGFSPIANHLIRLADTVESLTVELNAIKSSFERVNTFHHDLIDSKQDILEIKLMIKTIQDQNLLQQRDESSENTNPPQSIHSRHQHIKHSNGERTGDPRVTIMGSSSFQPASNPPSLNPPLPSANPSPSPLSAANHIRTSRNITFGTGNSSNNLSAAPARERKFDLLVGNCNLTTSVTDIVEHVKAISNINLLECVEHTTRVTHAKFFKITMKADDRDVLLNPNVWPPNISIRKFYQRRLQREQQEQNPLPNVPTTPSFLQSSQSITQ